MNKYTKFRNETDELLKLVRRDLEEECIKLYQSGHIDVDKFGDGLPKIILYAAIQNVSREYKCYDSWGIEARKLISLSKN